LVFGGGIIKEKGTGVKDKWSVTFSVSVVFALSAGCEALLDLILKENYTRVATP
jgi:hypothetical protein